MPIELLEKYVRITQAQHIMHVESARFYSKIDMCLSIPSSVLSYIVSGASILASITFTDTVAYPILIPVAILSATSGILTTITKKYKFVENYKDHFQSARDYQLLTTKIEFQLAMHKDDPDNIPLSSIEKRFEELQRKAPSIPERIERKYLSQKSGVDNCDFKKKMETRYARINMDVVEKKLRKLKNEFIV